MAAPRERPAPVAAVYRSACKALCIPPRHDFSALLRTPRGAVPPASPSFGTEGHFLADEHAVALCCALLSRHGASPRLVRSYLAESAAILTRCNTPATGAMHAYFPLPQHSPSAALKRARSTPYLTVDFSRNAALGPLGAAAVMAACTLIPGSVFIELDLHSCKGVTSVSLRPWLVFLEAERDSHSVFAEITGLNLDSCPVRSLDLDTMRFLSNLKWLALRHTAVTNMWRCSDMMRSLPHLAAILFKGSTRDEVEDQELELVRKFCNHSTLPDDLNSPLACSPSLSSALLRDQDPSPTRGGSHVQRGLHNDAYAEEADAYSAQTRVQFVGDTLHGPTDVANDTPVASTSSFFEFVLANAPPSLRLLDGVHVSAQQREDAVQVVKKNFEQLRCPDDLSHQFSLLSLLRNREDGFARPVPRISVEVSAVLEHRNKKRRKASEEESLRKAMLSATATGFTSKTPERVTTDANMAVAQAAGLLAAEVVREGFGSVARQAQEISAGVRDDLSERSQSSCPTSVQSSTESEDQSAQKLLRQGLTSFREGSFELSVSSSLIRRPGAPRIRYLKHEQDRPRQFEYNPARPSELVYGTEHGYMVVLDLETGEVKGSCLSGGGEGNRPTGQIIPQTSDLSSVSASPFYRGRVMQRAAAAAVYGLSWLHEQSDRFLAGAEDGAIHVYNVNWMGSGDKGGCMYACETFQHLTSLHVNCDDVSFAVSGRPPHVGLFDLETGRRTELLRRCHTQPINVIKFAHRSPHVLVTSSFDQFVKKWDLREPRPGGSRRPIFEARSQTDNVMVCFSPDDSRLLVSAVDNEVKQYSAVDGRLELEFQIPKTGSSNNFTRSYYMNDRDYIITGSCNENVVRVYNARTGGFFTEVDMDNRESTGGASLYVQSLRASPGRRFSFSALLASSSTDRLIANTDLHCR